MILPENPIEPFIYNEDQVVPYKIDPKIKRQLDEELGDRIVTLRLQGKEYKKPAVIFNHCNFISDMILNMDCTVIDLNTFDGLTPKILELILEFLEHHQNTPLFYKDIYVEPNETNEEAEERYWNTYYHQYHRGILDDWTKKFVYREDLSFACEDFIRYGASPLNIPILMDCMSYRASEVYKNINYNDYGNLEELELDIDKSREFFENPLYREDNIAFLKSQEADERNTFK